MAKFNMKDYDNFMKEEARQDRLQAELEDNRYFELLESERDWFAWQQKQRKAELEEKYDVYECSDCYFPECDDDYWDDDDEDDDPYDLLDADVPCESDNSLTAEDIYDMYDSYYYEDEEYYCDDDCECYLYPRCDACNCYPCEYCLEMQLLAEAPKDIELERIERKSIARNRHLNEIKAKKRDKALAIILEKRYQLSNARTPYENFRLYSRQAAAVKKAARVKTA